MSRAREVSDFIEWGPTTTVTSAKTWWHAENDATINNSYNVTSGSDNGVGVYDINITTPLENALGSVSQQTMRTATPIASGASGNSMNDSSTIEVRATTDAGAPADAETSGQLFGVYA